MHSLNFISTSCCSACTRSRSDTATRRWSGAAGSTISIDSCSARYSSCNSTMILPCPGWIFYRPTRKQSPNSRTVPRRFYQYYWNSNLKLDLMIVGIRDALFNACSWNWKLTDPVLPANCSVSWSCSSAAAGSRSWWRIISSTELCACSF